MNVCGSMYLCHVDMYVCIHKRACSGSWRNRRQAALSSLKMSVADPPFVIQSREYNRANPARATSLVDTMGLVAADDVVDLQ